MVPSDPSNSPFSDWHAQSELSMQCSGDAVLLLPVAAFARPRISAPGPICLLYLLEARVSRQAFARPQRLLPFESHRSEVSAPALSLQRSSELFFQPVRPWTPILGCVFTPPGYVRRPKPVAVFQAQSSQTSIQLPLPFRTFILPDRSAQSAAWSEKLAFVSGPFSLRSPQALINFC
jgi:hypothetical protein